MQRGKAAAALAAASALLSACDQDSSVVTNAVPTVVQRACSTLADTPVRVVGGTFLMGDAETYAEEGPPRETRVGSFWIDPHEITNRQFDEFVEATGYVTTAEKPVDPAQFDVPVAQIPPDMLKAGSAVFTPPDTPSNDYHDWWKYVPGANWRKPYGPEGAAAVPGEPVVHLSYEDMAAYAAWRGGRLPTEAEWEYAAAAGRKPVHDQPVEANSWQGVFPNYNEGTDGFKAIAPVGCYEANPFGLYDMVGNVWEMTADFYRAGHDPEDRDNPKGPSRQVALGSSSDGFVSRVIKGGSYLCAPNYCQRYRPQARTSRDPGLGTSNVGFRLVYDRQPAGVTA